MVEKKIILPEVEELAPEPPPKGPIVWAKDNLFYSVSSTLLTIFGAAIAVLFVRGMFGFILEDERKWEAITTNMRLLMIQAYPQEATWRIWLSLGIIVSLFGLSLAFWRAGGKQEPRVLGRAVAALGGLLIFVFVIAPFEGTVQIVGIVIGAVLVLASLGVMRLLGEKAKDKTVPVLLIGAILGALAVIAIWVIQVPVPDPEGGIGDTVLEPLATTTTVPWTILYFLTIVMYYLGKLLLRVVPERLGRIILVAGWVMSFPIIVLHLARGVEFQNVGQYLSIGLGFAVVGSLIIWYLADPARGELGRGLAGLLLVIAIASWVVSALILVRLLLLLLALFALGGPTFAGGETDRSGLRHPPVPRSPASG